jgi:Zn finger protein HypA/HybF involved in hydrogenase expression
MKRNGLAGKIADEAQAYADHYRQHGRIKRLKLRAGALANISPDHVRQQFARITRGTSLAGIELDFKFDNDPQAPGALHVVVVGVELED